MKNQKQTIRKIVGFLNNPDEDGGFWLPNIQRPFVWSEDQICRLFDSILREYPISTLLIWKTTSGIRRRSFIDNWKDSLRLSDFYKPQDEKKKNLVLDGQQRLQSLYIGLCGSFNGNELYFDVLSGEVSAPDDIKYRFKFLPTAGTTFPWVKFKGLVFTTQKKRELVDLLKANAGKVLEGSELNKLDDHLDLVDRTFKMDEAVTYQELDSIDNPKLYTEDDVVEVFIRANSGGTKLGKSDLLFSLLSASWEIADEQMEDLLDSLNKHGFAFDRDFVLKCCLVLLGHGARYEVAKFRKPGVREEIEKQWDRIAKSIQDVLDFVRGKTYLQCDKALPTYLVLIPLVYVRYSFPEAWKTAKSLDTYLLRASMAGAFSGVPDNLIDGLVSKFAKIKAFDVEEAFGVIRGQQRSLELTEDRFWQMGYGSDTVHLLFNLWYRDFNHTPAYDNNLPQIDHVFPQSALRRVKAENPKTGRKDLMKYREADRNQLANCMLLSKAENGAGGKWDTLPEEWFAGKDKDYLDKHLIPADPALWKLDRFEDFVAARKDLIREKFKSLLVASVGAKPA
ncbi:MAG: GmrSD restriction endonuclease domain-containing protein [Betaproteobacteria bacterium]